MECTLHAMKDHEIPEGEIIESLKLEKSWEALHFLLSASASEGEDAAQFLLGGKILEDVSEHVAIQQNDAVSAFNIILENTSDAELAACFDAAKLDVAQIYPGNWSDREFSYLEEYLGPLRKFISLHANKGNGILVVIA